MPAIAERAGEVLGRKIGPLPIGGWAAIGVGTIVVVKLLKGGGGGGSESPTAGGFALPDAGGDGGGGDGTTIPAASPPAGTGSPGGVKPLTVSISSKTSLYNAAHALIGHVTKATYTVTKGPSHGGGYYWYKITSTSSANYGKWIVAKPDATGTKLTVKA
jgi:hypothetical protein